MAAIIFKPEDNQYDYHMYLSALVSLNCFHLRKYPRPFANKIAQLVARQQPAPLCMPLTSFSHEQEMTGRLDSKLNVSTLSTFDIYRADDHMQS